MALTDSQRQAKLIAVEMILETVRDLSPGNAHQSRLLHQACRELDALSADITRERTELLDKLTPDQRAAEEAWAQDLEPPGF